jgi:hypothetical protein
MNYYAGVGSRETPAHIQNIAHHVGAYLASQGWVLRSGNATGFDDAIAKGVESHIDQSAIKPDPLTLKEIYLPWSGYNNAPRENPFVSPDKYPFSKEEVAFTAMHHPAWKKCSPSARLLHTRNTRIMVGLDQLHGEDVMPVSFVICWTENGAIKGGTGQAIRIAKALDIPIINLGHAKTPDELEQLVLRIDEYQQKLKNV